MSYKREREILNSVHFFFSYNEEQTVCDVLEVAKPGAIVYDFLINTKIGVSFGLKSVHESTDEPAKEDARTSPQQNDVVISPSQEKQQKIAEEVVGTSDQQYDVPQAKRQKEEIILFSYMRSGIRW